MRPTSIRHWIVVATTLAAFLMYLDRTCLAWMLRSDPFKREINLSDSESAWLKSAFFWAYALMQVPAGWLAERYGKRVLMTFLIALWSGFTALAGFSTGVTLLFIARLGCGIAEAGAYPISGSLLGRWAHIHRRGWASGVVSFGGRLGFAVAPALTAQLIAASNNWRIASWSYGFFGIGFAWFFWNIFRESPQEHPRTNEAERALLAEGRAAASPGTTRTPTPFPWRAVCSDFSLWMNCGMQFFTNIGYTFLFNSLSDFLQKGRGFDPKTDGNISTTALMIALAGTLCGGLYTDWCTRRFGVRLGRLVPWVSTRLLAACGFVFAMFSHQPWALVLSFALVAFASDAGLGATWAWAQDVGGRNVATIFGWGNMWGNFGAAIQPILLGWIALNFDHHHDWHASLLVSAGAYVVSGLFSLGINSARQVKGA